MMITKALIKDTIIKSMKIRFFVLCLIVVLLCLSFGSCKNEQTPEEQKMDLEEANSKNDSSKVEMKNKNIILHKTKAQYVIY